MATHRHRGWPVTDHPRTFTLVDDDYEPMAVVVEGHGHDRAEMLRMWRLRGPDDGVDDPGVEETWLITVPARGTHDSMSFRASEGDEGAVKVTLMAPGGLEDWSEAKAYVCRVCGHYDGILEYDGTCGECYGGRA